MDKSWSRWNSRSPNHYSSLGFYHTNATDMRRTNLFENGQVTVVYGKWTISNSGRSLDLELATAPPGSFSDWNFNRLTLVGKASKTIKGIELRSRFIYGHMNHDTRSSVPGQELYTINGAGAFDTFLRPYLRDESSFYGNTTLRQHYHLSGDVNLRGFFDTDLAGAQSLLGSTVEVIFNVPITFITLEAALFTDMAYFLPSDNLNEIKGQYLSDAGIGLRTQKNMFGKELYLRLDFPLVTNDSRSGRKQEFQWVFSFERSI
jgi:outer membrane protein assembly factor BamA